MPAVEGCAFILNLLAGPLLSRPAQKREPHERRRQSFSDGSLEQVGLLDASVNRHRSKMPCQGGDHWNQSESAG